MKRVNIFTLALTLGCWVGSASAALLDAEDALLVPYYEVSGNLATLIGVQHVATPPDAFSVINVAVYSGDDGALEARSDICLREDEFGFVVLQSAQPTAQDTAQGIYLSKAEDGISDRGFVTLAYGGSTSDCALTGTVATATTPPPADKNVMVAWAIMQDIGSGFFATEIPITEGLWAEDVDSFDERPARDPQTATCYVATVPMNVMNVDPGDPAPDDVNTAGNGCNTATNTFVPAGQAYCYSNTDENRTPVHLQLNDAKNGCNDPFTHTFVRGGTRLPKIDAVAGAPGVSFACTEADPPVCPGGLAVNADPPPTIGARFDVESSNRSVSNIYLWLDTAPPDGRDVQAGGFGIVCEDGTEPQLTASQLNRIDIDGKVSVINPTGLGCSGRGVLNLTLPRRAAVADGCYVSTNAAMTLVTDDAEATAVLDDLNNRCRSFIFTDDINNDGTAGDPGCYDAGISYVFTNDINNDGTIGDPGCYDQNASPRPTSSTTAVQIPDSGTATSCHPRPISSVAAVQIPDSGTATGCKSYTYVADVTADTPDGFIFSHIKQANDHFRMNFPGYKK